MNLIIICYLLKILHMPCTYYIIHVYGIPLICTHLYYTVFHLILICIIITKKTIKLHVYDHIFYFLFDFVPQTLCVCLLHHYIYIYTIVLLLLYSFNNIFSLNFRLVKTENPINNMMMLMI